MSAFDQLVLCAALSQVCPICSKEVTQAAGAEAPKAADVLGPRNK